MRGVGARIRGDTPPKSALRVVSVVLEFARQREPDRMPFKV